MNAVAGPYDTDDERWPLLARVLVIAGLSILGWVAVGLVAWLVVRAVRAVVGMDW